MKDPCACLRRESRVEHRAAENRDRDNRRAVVEYMLARGAFAGWPVNAHTPLHVTSEWINYGLHSRAESSYLLCIRQEPLPGAEWRKRNLVPRALELYERQTQYNNPKRGRPRPIGERYELVESVDIPHLDYAAARHDSELLP